MMARRVIAGRSEFSPKALFANGEQGVWYDPSDFSTLFQDAAGTIPVTAVEQPVGLVLDKSKGLALGPELVTNGDFSNGTTGWSAGGTSTVAVNAGVMRATGTTDGAFFGQQINVVSGTRYRLQFSSLSDGTSKAAQIILGTMLGTGGRYLGSIAFGTNRSVYYYATATETLWVWFYSGYVNTTNYILISGISVRELPGNHAFQTTSANRPTLSAWYNLLTKTEQFDDAAWTKTNATVTANATTAPDGTLTGDLLIETASIAEHHTSRDITATATTSYRFTCYVKRAVGVRNAFFQINNNGGGAGGAIAGIFDLGNSTATTATLVAGFSGLSASIVDVGNGWYLGTLAFITASDTTSLNSRVGVYNGGKSYTGDGTSGIYIWGADLRVANDGVGIPAYQRVNTATDYDTVGFPPYLRFNGSTQFLQTNSIDFTSTDKVLVAAGVRKLSNAVQAVVELSSNINLNSGAFEVFYNSPNTIEFGSKGTLGTYPISAVSAPATKVIGGLGDISGDSAILRINGAQAASSTADQGTGNYGNYPLYIGARDGSRLYFNGRLYSLIVRGAQTPANLIAATERYVARKTGVTL